MAYDEDLAGRIRQLLEAEPGVVEKRMFGGLGFMVDGHLAIAASSQGGLLLRVPPQDADELLEEPHVEAFVMRQRAMEGWVRVAPAGLEDEAALRRFAEIGVGYARSLPPKQA